jgi:ubiquinone/menaquinone biosynthesis methyltransferase
MATAVDVRGMFDRIAERYDAANRAMSVGIDIVWRKKAMAPLLVRLPAAPPPRILDLGAGTLDGALEIRRRRPDALVVAADFARQMLRVGRAKRDAGAVSTHAADGHHLPYAAASFDAAFSAFCVRNLRDLPAALTELRRVVRPGGTVVILEFFRPGRPRMFFDRLYNARLLPLVGWLVSGDREAYRYLPASIQGFLSRAEFEQRLRDAGFPDAAGQDLFPAGVASLVVAR